jgi:tetratricopeptide (TPR) repeat protein
VFRSEQKLRHLPFFEEIARHEESEPEWKASTAGLLLLRFVDAWIEEGAHVVDDDGWALRSLHGAVDAIDERNNLRTILNAAIEILADTRVTDMRLLAPRLMAYGQFLEYEANWSLAADVYETLISHAHPTQESDVATQAHLRRGFCLRNTGDLGASVSAYQAAEQLAEAAKDMEGVLRARLGEAKTAIALGNFPKAESILDRMIGIAGEHNFTDLRARALHDRATVAGERGDYQLSIKLAYEALEIAQSPRDRDRILGDIAVLFYRLGVRSAARDAYLILAATAQEQYSRWLATLNLMEVAADDGDEVLFERYRRSVDVSRLPPNLAIQYWLDGGKGLERLGHLPEARVFLERAIAFAEEHSLNQYVFRAEEALRELGRHPVRITHAEPTLQDSEIENIARHISAERAKAGV